VQGWPPGRPCMFSDSEAWGWGTHLPEPGFDGIPGSGKSANLANLANLANISGAGRGGNFKFTVVSSSGTSIQSQRLCTARSLDIVMPSALRRVEGILADAAGGFRVQLASGAGSGGEGLTQPEACGSNGGSGFVAVHHRLRLDMEELGDPGASRR
jgi:hypothetical protein